MVSSGFYISFILLGTLSAANAFPKKREESCEASYLKLGCYNDKHASGHRPLPLLLFTDRDVTKKFSGKSIEWNNMDVYMKGLACRCAKRAKAGGYMFFGLQYYGECWASTKFTFNIDGIAESCVSSNFEPCSPASKTCVGVELSIFVYNVQL